METRCIPLIGAKVVGVPDGALHRLEGPVLELELSLALDASSGSWLSRWRCRTRSGDWADCVLEDIGPTGRVLPLASKMHDDGVASVAAVLATLLQHVTFVPTADGEGDGPAAAGSEEG